MRRSIKPLVISLTIIFAVSTVITGILFLTQIWPDIERYGHPGGANTQEYNEQWTLPFPVGTDLSIDMSAVSVEIRAYDGAALEAVFSGTRNTDSGGEFPHIEAVEESGRIVLRERHGQRRAVLNIGIWNSGNINGTLTVRVPRAMMGELSVDTFSGNIAAAEVLPTRVSLSASSGRISISDIYTEGDISVNTFSGSQTLEGVSGRDINLDASSGRISLSRISARNLNAAEFSGNIDMSDAEITEVSRLSTSSGTITGENISVPQLEFNTFSGRVLFKGLTSGSIDGETSSGNVELKMDSGADANITTFSGRVEMGLPKDTGFRYDVDTFSGRIEIGSTGLSISKGEISGTVGDGAHKLTISTSSGGVKISDSNE